MMFRELLKEISLFMGYEITRDFPLTYEEIETPLQKMKAPTSISTKPETSRTLSHVDNSPPLPLAVLARPFVFLSFAIM